MGLGIIGWIVIGIIALLLWFRRASRTYAVAKPADAAPAS